MNKKKFNPLHPIRIIGTIVAFAVPILMRDNFGMGNWIYLFAAVLAVFTYFLIPTLEKREDFSRIPNKAQVPQHVGAARAGEGSATQDAEAEGSTDLTQFDVFEALAYIKNVLLPEVEDDQVKRRGLAVVKESAYVYNAQKDMAKYPEHREVVEDIARQYLPNTLRQLINAQPHPAEESLDITTERLTVLHKEIMRLKSSMFMDRLGDQEPHTQQLREQFGHL